MKRFITIALLLAGLAVNSVWAAETVAPTKEAKAPAKGAATKEGEKGVTTLQSCAGAPATAITKIPEPLNAYAAVHCSKLGHVIGSTKEMLWQTPKGSKAIYPAQNLNHNDLSKVDPNAHFIEITLSAPSKEESEDIIRNMASKGMFRDKYRHTLLHKLYARSSKGMVYTLYFAHYTNDKKTIEEITALSCTPDCLAIQGKNSGVPFVVVYKEPPKPPKGDKAVNKPKAAAGEKKAP